MEEVVGSDIDRTLKENDEYLANINRLNQPRSSILFTGCTGSWMN